MLRFALIFLMLALVSGVMAATEAGFVSAEIAWLLFIVFLFASALSFIFRYQRVVATI